MYSTTDFKKGLKIEIDGAPYTIVEFLHVKPGKGGAFVRTRPLSCFAVPGFGRYSPPPNWCT